MTTSRSFLCVLTLAMAFPAQAMDVILKRYHKGLGEKNDVVSVRPRSAAAAGDPANTVDSVDVRVSSDAGDEDVVLVESNAWLHGTAPIAALPVADARLHVTLYDDANTSLMTFSGTLGTDGSVTLIADATKDIDTGSCGARVGCADDTSDTTAPDIELLGSELFAAAAGYELGLDLAGADTYAVAYAEITVVASDEVTTCSKETGECTTTGSTTTETAEVSWDEVGAIWEGELSTEPSGLVEVKVKAYDAAGTKLETAKVKLGAPWLDGGEGVNALATDDDPLTTIALQPGPGVFTGAASAGWDNSALTVVSEGWTRTTYPTDAEVQLTGGRTVTLRASRYSDHKSLGYSEEGIYVEGLETARVVITGGTLTIADYPALDLLTPVCSADTCVVLVPVDSGYIFSFTTYAASPAALAEAQDYEVEITDAGGEVLYADTLAVEFDGDVAAVFATEIGFTEDPTGLDLSGKVSLLAAADKRGKQKTLAKGKFFGTFSRDADGDGELTGADKDEVVSSGDIVVAGEPIGLEAAEGDFTTPPVLLYGNGVATQATCLMEKLDLEVDVDVK